MSIKIEALKAPTKDTLDEWLNTPRPSRCGEYFTPSKPMWNPDKYSPYSINWQVAITCVQLDWQPWLHAALAYRMAEVAQSTIHKLASVLFRASEERLGPLNENHLIYLRERFNSTEFSHLAAFMVFWYECESLEQRPSYALADAYKELPRKKRSKNDPVLSLDPEKGPFTRAEQDALHQWLHEQFCHRKLDPEHYLYLRLLMIYGQRGTQFREMIFDDFIKFGQGYKIRIHWAKQKDGDGAGFRGKSESFNFDEDLYNTVQAYKTIVLGRLKQEYPDHADWDKAIHNVPLFRRKLAGKGRPAWLDVNTTVLLDHHDHKELEDAPQPRFHAPVRSVKFWLESMERMPGFPISPRTHQPLKVTKGHRFRYTLGTDLSNAGLDEWSIARALMHSDTRTVRKYRQVSAELMTQVDEKLSDHLVLVVNAFTGTIVKDRTFAKNGDREERLIEDLAVCGADALCHLDAPFSCYACCKFQPLLSADHSVALKRMERRREQTIVTDKTTGVLWDRAILACKKVILDCKALSELSNLGEDKA
jgi:integrase